MTRSSRRQPTTFPLHDLGHRIVTTSSSSVVLRVALLIPLIVSPFFVDTTRAHVKMGDPKSVTAAYWKSSHQHVTGSRKWVHPAAGSRIGAEGRRERATGGSQCTLTLFCWLAGGWPARRGCTLEAGGGALVTPWWLITARCTPQDAPFKHMAVVRRPPPPPQPPLPDRRYHIVSDNPRPPPQPPTREVECGIPRLSPRGISYQKEGDDAAGDDSRRNDDFLDDSEDGTGVGEAAAPGEDPGGGGSARLRPDILTKRIVGGSEARFGEFPWQAHIRIAGYQCGGVLVGRAHVATAAHCVHRARLRDITVFLGEYDTQNTGLYSEPLPGEARRVVKKVIHPEFQYRVTQPDRFDLALLRLSRPVSYRANIIPICLPTAGQDAVFKGRLGVVAGWGKTDTSYGKTGTNILHKATVPILKDDECLRWHRSKNIRLQLHSEMFCAGHRDGHSDACLGDSGGPLVVLVAGRWTLAGITSAGFGCAVDHQPGIYHKVAVTADWIAEHVS